MARSDDFTKAVQDELAFRVNCRCSNPRCRRPTTGPMLEEEGHVRLGEAAHICAASSNGPRYDASMTSKERKSAANGIWLCRNCHKMVDRDVKRYPVEKLRQWKQMAEEQAYQELENTRLDADVAFGRAVRKLRPGWVAAFGAAAVVLVVAAILLVGNLGNKEKYSEYMDLAYFEVENQNYLEAARLFDRAEAQAYDDASSLEARYGLGMCYLAYAFQSPEDSDEYFHNALRYYVSIITDFEIADSAYYIDAIVDCCHVYYFLDYSYSDSNWKAAITWLEDRYDPIQLSSMDELSTGLGVKIVLAVAMYYADAAEESFASGTISAEYEKSMVCYQNALQLLKKQKEENAQSFYDGEEVFEFLEEYANRTLNVYAGQMIDGTKTENAMKQIDAVIDLCQTACSNMDTATVSDMYVRLGTTTGKAYWVKALLSDGEDIYLYLRKAYETLMPLVKLQLDENYQANYYTDAGMYAVSTIQCSKSDLESVIALYRLELAYCEQMGYIDYRVKVLGSACAACETIFRYHERYRDIAEPFAKEVVEEMESKWSNHLTQAQAQSLAVVKAMIE